MAIYKDKIRNTWYFRVYITNKSGKRVQKTRSGFKTKNECRQAEIKFSLNYKDKNNDILFIDLYNVYIIHKKQNLKYQPFRTLENRFKNHILPYFKDYKINNIRAIDYIEWKNNILSKNFAYSYNSSLHQSMVNILDFAQKFYNLEENIAKKIGNFSRNDYVPNVNFWTLEEFKKFIFVIDDTLYKTFFQFLYSTGVRKSEALALSWNDLKNDYVDINKTLIRSSIKNYKFNSPKTKSSNRKVKISDFLLSQLNELKDYYKGFYGFNDEWFIFGGIKPLSTTTIDRKKDYYCKLSNVKKIRIHDIRHSHASLLLSKGIPITVISKRLGHSNIDMTLRVYSHLIPQDEDVAISLLNNLEI